MPERYASLKQGLVGCWIPSVSGSGFLLPDLSGRGNNGTLTNMASDDWVSAQYGRALDFDGVDDYVALPVYAKLPFSVSLWFYGRTNDNLQQLFTIGNSTNLLQLFAITLRGDLLNDPIHAQMRGSDSNVNTRAEVFGYTKDKWHHVTAVFGATNFRQIWLNGIAGTADTTNYALETFDRQAIAALDRLTISGYLSGQVDDVRQYNRVLSESEIRILAFRPGIGLTTQRRTAYYAPPTRRRNHLLIGNMF